MPLLDHFRASLNHDRHWKGFHSYWASALVLQLNKSRLPDHYFAEPQINIGVSVEVDVATLEKSNGRAEGVPLSEGGVATAAYAPPQPSLVFPVDYTTGSVTRFILLLKNHIGTPRFVTHWPG